MRIKRLMCALVFLLAGVFASAQFAPDTRITEVVVEGTDTFADIVRVVLATRSGSTVGSVDVEAERNRVYALGSFASVSVNLQDRSRQPVLVVTVSENPRINRLQFVGVTALDTTLLAEVVQAENILGPGRVLNTARAQEAVATIQAIYRQQGFPFQVPVTVELFEVVNQENVVETVVEYIVDEAPPIEDVVVNGVESVDAEAVSDLFRPLTITGSFQPGLYRTALTAVDQLYAADGYRLSGVDVTSTYLEAGILNVNVVERRISAVDTSAIDLEASELSLGIGDLFNYDVLLDDVRRITEGATSDIRLVTQAIGSGGVRVSFEVGPPETAGAITGIEIRGSTVIPAEELAALLELREGDTFTSTLATEDFNRLVEYYAELGFIILPEPDFNWIDGVYVQTVHEVTIQGHQVTFEGERGRTQDFVVSRYLPPVGVAVNQFDLRNSLIGIQQLGAVEPVNIVLLSTTEPDEVIVNAIVRETSTGVFTPSAQYSTDAGFSMSLSYTQSNLWGRAHALNLEVTGQTSAIGLLFGGSIRYSIPWLYLDFLDFQTTPTSLSVSVFSLATSNQVMSAGSSLRQTYPGLPDIEQNQVPVGEYTTRDSGASFSVGRPILPNTYLNLSGRFVNTVNYQQPATDCTFDAAGNVVDAEACSLPFGDASQYLPQGGSNAFIGPSLTYDSRDSGEFPRRGILASASYGFGFGNDYTSPDTGLQTSYNYQQLELGFRTYLMLNRVFPALNDNHVLAFRVNFGHQFGSDYPVGKRFVVGKTNIDATSIRGYQAADFGLSRTYATSSIEYRYDFGLDTFATQTVIGIIFADLGYASTATGFAEYDAPMFAGAGLGVQVNLGFGGVALPALRFDYAFSERHPTGEFRFRVGTVF